MGRETIIKILMERDNLTEKESVKLFKETQRDILNNPLDAEQILIDNLSLEMDYIFEFL